jgi:hypothetical protein
MSRARVSGTAGVLGYGDLASSLLLILPLFLAYEIGVVFASSINGVDFMTRTMLAAVNHDRGDYLLVQLALVGSYLALLWLARARGVLEPGAFLPMVLESSIYALTLGSFIILIMQELLGFSLAASAAMSLGRTGEALIISLGAGVHEELVFRLGIMAGSAWLLHYAGMRRSLAIAAGAVLAAVLFSLAHHSGPHGEPFHVDVFTYRALAGGVFGLIFYYRSLAHAVYTHFLYDMYVLALQS